jgi:hypothetical protein
MKPQGIITVMMASDSSQDRSPLVHIPESFINDQNQTDPGQKEILSRHLRIKHHVQQKWGFILRILFHGFKTKEMAHSANH